MSDDGLSVNRRHVLAALVAGSAGCAFSSGPDSGQPSGNATESEPTDTPFGYGGTPTATESGSDTSPSGGTPSSTPTPGRSQGGPDAGSGGGGGRSSGGSAGGGSTPTPTETPGDYGIQGYGEYGYGGVFP